MGRDSSFDMFTLKSTRQYNNAGKDSIYEFKVHVRFLGHLRFKIT